jgi:hypothetical protein
MCPRTSPTALAFPLEIMEDAAPEAGRLAFSEPVRQAAGAPADKSPPLEAFQPRLFACGVAYGPLHGNNLGHRLVPVEHQHRPATPDVLQVTGEVVLELGDPGSFHVAIIAISRPPVNIGLYRWLRTAVRGQEHPSRRIISDRG